MINKSSPDEIVVACNGSPMVIGLGQGKTFIASETSAFSKYTKSFVALKDGEIGVVRAHGRSALYLIGQPVVFLLNGFVKVLLIFYGVDNSLDLLPSRVETAPDHFIELTPDPYPHFTLKVHAHGFP